MYYCINVMVTKLMANIIKSNIIYISTAVVTGLSYSLDMAMHLAKPEATYVYSFARH